MSHQPKENTLETERVEEALDSFIRRRRPPPELRDRVDLAYRIEGRSVVIFETRPHFKRPSEKMESLIAKATFIKSRNLWKVFWRRADDRWHGYRPAPEVPSIDDFLALVDEDKLNCFFG